MYANGLIYVQSRHLPGGTEVNHEHPEDSRCPGEVRTGHSPHDYYRLTQQCNAGQHTAIHTTRSFGRPAAGSSRTIHWCPVSSVVRVLLQTTPYCGWTGYRSILISGRGTAIGIFCGTGTRGVWTAPNGG